METTLPKLFIFFSFIILFLRVLEVKIFRTFTAMCYSGPFYFLGQGWDTWEEEAESDL